MKSHANSPYHKPVRDFPSRSRRLVVWSALALCLLRAAPHDASAACVLEYRFNETGVTVPSTGSDSTPLTLRDTAGTATDLHGTSGSGVSGLAGDLAFDNSASTMSWTGGRADQADNNALDNFTSFTLQGWLKTSVGSPSANAGRLFDKNDGNGIHGYFLGWNGGVMTLQVAGAGGVNAVDNGSALYLSANSWVFFAVTYDGTGASNNVKFYKGTATEGVVLAETLTLDTGILGDGSLGLGVGNATAGTRAFQGLLDNMRIYGSTSDSSGVLSGIDLESIRANDVLNIPEPSSWALVSLCFAAGISRRGRSRSARTHPR